MNPRQQDTLSSKQKEIEGQMNILKKLSEENPGLLGIEKAIKELEAKLDILPNTL